METANAVVALDALAQESRLDIFRLLVRAGPAGLPAGEIAERLALPASNLSFHLNQLVHAGLARRNRVGRSVIYAPDFEAMTALLGFLTEECCGGSGCGPAGSDRAPAACKENTE